MTDADDNPLRASMPEVDVTSEARRWLLNLTRACDLVIDDLYEWGRQARWIELIDESPRAIDTGAVRRKYGPGGGWSAQPIDRAVHTSIVHLGAALQHVMGIRALLSARAVMFSVAPITRSIIEICARINWTLAPTLPLETRARTARMILIEVDDITRAKSLAKALGNRRELTRCGDALYELRRVRIPSLFFPSEIERTKRGGLILCGQQLPGLSRSVETLKVPGLYAALSAATHPTLFLTLKMLAPPLPSECDPGASVPLIFRLRELDPVATLVRNALLALLQAWTALASYQGINADVLDDAQEQVVALATTPTEGTDDA